MDKYFIIHSPQFREELARIIDYFIYSYLSPQSAIRFYDKVKSTISKLDLFPEGYSKIYGSKQLQNRNLRKIPVGNYIIIYETDNYNHVVTLLHIFHGSQDYLHKI